MVLNELSFDALADDRYVARERMRSLVKTIRAGVHSGIPSVVDSWEDMWHALLAPDYSLAQWYIGPHLRTQRFGG